MTIRYHTDTVKGDWQGFVGRVKQEEEERRRMLGGDEED